MTRHEVPLPGCTPEPLMSYLKALGLLRLVAEQNDPTARGFWRDGWFVLSSALTGEALSGFFADPDGYVPTPVFAPWNGDGGFLTDAGTSFLAIQRVRESQDPRMRSLRSAIDEIDSVASLRELRSARDTEKRLTKRKSALKKAGQTLPAAEAEALRHASHQVRQIKSSILAEVRNAFPETVVRWLDASLVLLPDGFRASPLLGSGGCDGRLEFSANFLANLEALFTAGPDERRAWVDLSLFGRGVARLERTAIGQFAPGQIGGPNATQGLEGDSGVNPLDFVLMIEGALLIAGAVSRRHAVTQHPKAAFPFTVQASAAGYGSSSDREAAASRGELWLPIWSRSAGLAELAHVFAEGRAEVGGRQASAGVDFARAVASYGVDRGLDGFVRYAFLPRSGRAFLAAPIGRFEVVARPAVDLLREADAWLERLRSAVSDKDAPHRFRQACRRIDSAIFDFCRHGGPARFAEILCALGQAERELATGARFRDAKRLRPLAGLTPGWIEAANDGSVEFRIALALAGIHDGARSIGPIRSNLEPVRCGATKSGAPFATWVEAGNAITWTGANLTRNLARVLERRLMDASRAGSVHPPLDSRCPASLEAMSAFLAGQTDDARIEELVWGLVLANLQLRADAPHSDQEQVTWPIPRSYALLKLLFLPLAHGAAEHVPPAPMADPQLLGLLRAGRMADACALAMRRLRATGWLPMPHRTGRRTRRDTDWTGAACGLDAARIAGALLIPISLADARRLAALVLRPETEKSAATH